MYEELIKSLKICGTSRLIGENCIAFHDGCCEAEPVCMYKLMRQAADAIEELQKKYLASERDATNLTGWLAEEHAKHLWIPVTERLPEEAGKYLVCGRWRGKQTEIWVCEFMILVGRLWWANKAENPPVTYWRPLPEPPKEET